MFDVLVYRFGGGNPPLFERPVINVAVACGGHEHVREEDVLQLTEKAGREIRHTHTHARRWGRERGTGNGAGVWVSC